MRTMLSIIVGLLGGFILGIALSSVIGVISYLVFDEPFGIKFLPYFTSLVGAVATPVLDKNNRK